jgi:hypothetical protein
LSDFKENPEKLISPKIGLRHSETAIYFLDKNIQVVCGCFKGTLEEFKEKIKEKIKETHNDNEYAKQYFKWIESVENYMEAVKGLRDE